MRNINDKHDCPLLKMKILWGDCVEVQDIRDDNMDADLFPVSFDINTANTVCEQCRWYYDPDPNLVGKI